MRTFLSIAGGLLVLCALGAVIVYFPEWKAARDRQLLIETPLRSTYSADASGNVRGTRSTFSIGSYGVTDFGNLRLAFENWGFSGTGSGTVTLSAPDRKVGGGGSSGSGKRRFAHRFKDGAEYYQFGATEFRVEAGVLHFDDREFDVLGPRILVIVGRDKRVKDVVDLEQATAPGR